MEEWSWLITTIGSVLVLLVLVDVLLTVLHVDVDGPLASRAFHAVWAVMNRATRRWPAVRRSGVALAGPVMIVVALALWMSLFVLGFALIYWPFMELFHAEATHRPLGFAEALYFSGVTATVLGYGDVSPERGVLQAVSFLQAGLGFALLTGIVTYVINVVSGVADRNALALRLWIMTGETGDGTQAVVRSLAQEGGEGLHLRLHALLPATLSIHQKMRQFPILDLFYRSRDPVYAPELMVRISTEMAVAARLAAVDTDHARLGPIAEELGRVTDEIMALITVQHLGRAARDRLADSAPKAEDRAVLRRMQGSVAATIPGLDGRSPLEEEPLLKLLARARVLLQILDELTGWRMDRHPGVQGDVARP